MRDLPTLVPLYDWLFLGIGGVCLILVGRLLLETPVTVEMRAAYIGRRASRDPAGTTLPLLQCPLPKSQRPASH